MIIHCHYFPEDLSLKVKWGCHHNFCTSTECKINVVRLGFLIKPLENTFHFIPLTKTLKPTRSSGTHATSVAGVQFVVSVAAKTFGEIRMPSGRAFNSYSQLNLSPKQQKQEQHLSADGWFLWFRSRLQFVKDTRRWRKFLGLTE